MSDEIEKADAAPAEVAPEVQAPEVRAPEASVTDGAPVATGGHTGLGHALYIFGVVTAIVIVISAVVWVRQIKREPKPKPAPVAVIVHEPAPVKEQDRVEVRTTPVVVEPVVPAVREPEPTPEAAPAPAVVPEVVQEIAPETAPAIETPSASETVPHAVRKRTHRPQRHRVEAVEPREVGFWASFMRAAARIAKGPSR